MGVDKSVGGQGVWGKYLRTKVLRYRVGQRSRGHLETQAEADPGGVSRG